MASNIKHFFSVQSKHLVVHVRPLCFWENYTPQLLWFSFDGDYVCPVLVSLFTNNGIFHHAPACIPSIKSRDRWRTDAVCGLLTTSCGCFGKSNISKIAQTRVHAANFIAGENSVNVCIVVQLEEKIMCMQAYKLHNWRGKWHTLCEPNFSYRRHEKAQQRTRI